MGKKKKVSEKLLSFYRGPFVKQPQVFDDSEIEIISSALKDCLRDNGKNSSYGYHWKQTQPLPLKIIFGLNSTLRCLKQGRTVALICDMNSLTTHLLKHLNYFAKKESLPIVQVPSLKEILQESKVTSLSVISIVRDVTGHEELYQKTGQPKTNPTVKQKTSESFNRMCKLLLDTLEAPVKPKFMLPLNERVPATGKSKIKKDTKKKLAASKSEAYGKQEHVCDAPKRENSK